MNKLIFVLTGWLLCATTILAQSSYSPATEVQKNDLVAKIKQTADGMKTMKCDFSQVKELSFMDEKVTAEGRMFYSQSNKIRWEYTKPYTYVFATDGKNMFTGTGSATGKIPVKSGKLFSEISRIMIGGVSGSGLVDSPDFSTLMETGKEDFRLTLTPLKKEIIDLFSAVRLYVRKTDYRIRAVELEEKSGDRTSIELKNIQLNLPVDDEIFTR
jgi:outer membrane lipoprotein-sorting protein